MRISVARFVGIPQRPMAAFLVLGVEDVRHRSWVVADCANKKEGAHVERRLNPLWLAVVSVLLDLPEFPQSLEPLERQIFPSLD